MRRGRRAGSEDGLGGVCKGMAPAGQAAGRRLRRGAPASAEPKRPAGVLGLCRRLSAGGGMLAEHMLTTTLFAVIMKSHIIEKESIP